MGTTSYPGGYGKPASQSTAGSRVVAGQHFRLDLEPAVRVFEPAQLAPVLHGPRVRPRFASAGFTDPDDRVLALLRSGRSLHPGQFRVDGGQLRVQLR